MTVIALLLAGHSRHLAFYWGGLFALTGLLVTGSKLAFMGFGVGIPRFDFTGFSGHSALSSAFWPVFLWLLVRPASFPVRLTAVLLGFMLAGLIGYSRVVIHAHSPSEVLAGLCLGTMATLLFFVFSKRSSVQVGKGKGQFFSAKVRLCLALIPLCLFDTGIKAPTQSMLGEIALHIGTRKTVFTRTEMHRLAQADVMASAGDVLK